VNYYAATEAENITLEFSAPPERSTPIKGVDLWFLDLSKITEGDSEKFALQLSANELEHAQQFKKKQHHFLATRALLRTALSLYTDIPAQELQIARTDEGKPFLTNAPHPIYFNLTHSGNFAVLAVTSRGEVGVDIETARNRSYLKIVERYFHPNEINYLYTSAEAQREQIFYRLWTLKEAFFKAIGTGISTGLDKAYFSFDGNSITADFAPALNLQKNDWQFYQELIAAKTVVAVALNSAEQIQHQWFDGNSLLDK
jgi:4'-phosphopantetheinyl transferase